MADEFQEVEGNNPVEQPSTSGDGGNAPAQSQHDYSKDFESMRFESQRMMEQNRALLDEVKGYKGELADRREEDRKRTLLFAGDKKTIQEHDEQLRQEAIKQELYKIAPHLKDLENAKPNQPNLAEQAFFNNARHQAKEFAKNIGFESDLSQEMMVYLGDILINSHPQWKERFYGQGDTSVLKEVSEFFTKNVLEPRDKNTESRVYEKLRKTNRFASPTPPAGRGGPPKEGSKPKIDSNDPNARQSFLKNLFNSHAASNSE